MFMPGRKRSGSSTSSEPLLKRSTSNWSYGSALIIHPISFSSSGGSFSIKKAFSSLFSFDNYRTILFIFNSSSVKEMKKLGIILPFSTTYLTLSFGSQSLSLDGIVARS